MRRRAGAISDMKTFTYPPDILPSESKYSSIYKCNNHPVYFRASLYTDNDLGMCIIQQRYDKKTKCTYWTELDPWIADLIYMDSKFPLMFKMISKRIDNGLYPTITVRQAMWILRMKPLKKEVWETSFDHKPI